MCERTFLPLELGMARQPHRRRSRLLLVAVPLLLVACTDRTPSGTPVDFTLRDFKITSSMKSVPAGDVVLRVSNQAPVTHEFVAVRTDLPADELPIGPDGLSVNEDWLSSMGEIDEVKAGTTGVLALTLPPGRYVFFCNLEGHYLGGMHAVLEVPSA
jgi:uncharacterized cupredoxin-like copper-binding protein